VALDPSYSEAHKLYADFLTDVGRYDEAFREITRAQELDPLWGIHVRSYARTLAAAGRIDEAVAEYRRALSRDPDSYRLYLRLAELFERKGAYDDAVAMRERAEVLAASRAEPGDLACCQEDADILAKEYREHGFQAAMHALFRRKLARLIEQSRDQYVSPFTFALVYARLDDVDHVIAELERAVRDRTSELAAWRLYPELEPFSTDARLRRTLADAGLFVQ
jgi:tetratricopeptide (TPR) repeat protein